MNSQEFQVESREIEDEEKEELHKKFSDNLTQYQQQKRELKSLVKEQEEYQYPILKEKKKPFKERRQKLLEDCLGENTLGGQDSTSQHNIKQTFDQFDKQQRILEPQYQGDNQFMPIDVKCITRQIPAQFIFLTQMQQKEQEEQKEQEKEKEEKEEKEKEQKEKEEKEKPKEKDNKKEKDKDKKKEKEKDQKKEKEKDQKKEKEKEKEKEQKEQKEEEEIDSKQDISETQEQQDQKTIYSLFIHLDSNMPVDLRHLQCKKQNENDFQNQVQNLRSMNAKENIIKSHKNSFYQKNFCNYSENYILNSEISDDMVITKQFMQKNKLKKILKYEIELDNQKGEYVFSRYGEKNDLVTRAKLFAEYYLAHDIDIEEQEDLKKSDKQKSSGHNSNLFDSLRNKYSTHQPTIAHIGSIESNYLKMFQKLNSYNQLTQNQKEILSNKRELNRLIQDLSNNHSQNYIEKFLRQFIMFKLEKNL